MKLSPTRTADETATRQRRLRFEIDLETRRRHERDDDSTYYFAVTIRGRVDAPPGTEGDEDAIQDAILGPRADFVEFEVHRFETEGAQPESPRRT